MFDEDRAAHETERAQKEKTSLQHQKAGTLTQAQADKITNVSAKMKADMEANKDAMKSKTDAERKAAMDYQESQS